MGALLDRDLRNPLPPLSQPRPAGALRLSPDHSSVTRIECHGSTWMYGEELHGVAIALSALEECDLGGGEFLFWSGLAARVPAQSVAAAAEGGNHHHLAAALAPASSLWCAHAPLLAAGADPFETDPAWLTARLDDPMRIHWEQGEVQGDGFLMHRGVNRVARNPCWYFALCPEDPADIVEAIFPTQALLLVDAIDGTLSERFRRNNKQVTAKRVPVSFTEPLAAAVLRWAIRFALAGRAGGATVTLGANIERTYLHLLEDYADRARRSGTGDEPFDPAAFLNSLALRPNHALPPVPKGARLVKPTRLGREMVRQHPKLPGKHGTRG